MLFLDSVYIERCKGLSQFRWVKAPTSRELAQLAHTIAQRVGRFLERQGLLERDAENSYLARDAVDEDPIAKLLGHSITCGIAVGPQAGRKAFTLQTLLACDPEDQFGDTVGTLAGFSLHAGVAARADERKKLKPLCRHIFYLGRSLESKPLIYPTLYKSVTFTLLVVLFKLAEHAIKGLVTGEGVTAGIAEFIGQRWQIILANGMMLYFAPVPFFAVKEMGRVLGREKIASLFFRPRSKQ